MTRSETCVLGLLGLGAALVAVSLAWPWLNAPEAVWSEEDATRRGEINMDFHRLVHEMGHTRDEAKRQDFVKQIETAQKRVAEADAELADARRRYDRPARWLFWAGWTCLAVGVAVWLAVRGRGG